ncbi:CD82 antigen isoform X1 [Canis lupus dingo]|uniref:CD82 antigen isoform X1 n=1 Tax=Canis lupus dingo TaxID=286419 RepID=UPI0020C40172|nr:CD82 antigen isoform X1 [Canis lupus dingo]
MQVLAPQPSPLEIFAAHLNSDSLLKRENQLLGLRPAAPPATCLINPRVLSHLGQPAEYSPNSWLARATSPGASPGKRGQRGACDSGLGAGSCSPLAWDSRGRDSPSLSLRPGSDHLLPWGQLWCAGQADSAVSGLSSGELQDRQDGVSLYQSHQVLSLPLQLALLYPGRGDPGFRGVDPGRQEQFHLCATDLLQLPQGGGLCLHRCGCRHHVHGLPGLHRCHQGGPLPAGAVLCLPPPHAHRPGGRWSPLLLQHRQAKARDGQHRDEAHPGLQGRPRGQTAGGLGLRAGSGEVLRLGQLLQLDGQCRAHEPHQCHLPLLLRG